METSSLNPQNDVPTKRRSSKPIYWVGLLVIFLITGYLIGRGAEERVVISSANTKSELDFSLFDRVFHIIQTEHVAGPTDLEQLEFGAIRGLVAGLNDPNSNFMDPEERTTSGCNSKADLSS